MSDESRSAPEGAARLASALADRYRLERELGAGGMATVYLAHDIKHDRHVALKVLKPELAAVLGAERFVQEIKTTAALQHPHILPLFDSGTADGFLYYVMPFIDGETLRAKLDRETQLSIDEAVKITTSVADALDYAHRQGVIHRDIKPENILLHDGRPMVADFGIALALSAAAGGRMTETGMSLGTPHYMSPEQATAEKEISARSDVYSLASVLYEMLAGQPPHLGGSAQQIIMKIIAEPAEPVTKYRKSVPANVAAALTHALEKLPADRFDTARAFAEALVNPAFGHDASGEIWDRPVQRLRDPVLLVFGLVAIASTAAAIWLGVRNPQPTGPETSTFAVGLPPSQSLSLSAGVRLQYAPDGKSFVYVGSGGQLFLRQLDALDATPIAGSEGATSPEYSPDGQEIGFTTFRPFGMRIISTKGGQARTIPLPSSSGGGLAWSADGFIYFDAGSGLARIRPDGSEYKMMVALDSANGESGVSWPAALPGGRGILMRIRRVGEPTSNYSIVVLDLQNGQRTELLHGLVARYSPTGHLLWVSSAGELLAQRFDLKTLELSGQSVVLRSGLAVGAFGSADISLSPGGDLLYITSADSTAVTELSWMSRSGSATVIDTVAEHGQVSSLVLSPDGASVAMDVVRPSVSADLHRIWVKRLAGGSSQMISSELAHSRNPLWSPDGRDIYYTANGSSELRRRHADGSGGPLTVARSARGFQALTITPDGQTLVTETARDGFGKTHLQSIRPGVDSQPVPLFAASMGMGTLDPALSRDGNWLAYTSSESGPPDVYVRPFRSLEARKVMVSTGGGMSPRWSALGDELFFISAAGDLMAAGIRTTPEFTVDRVTRLFNISSAKGVYDVHPGGQRFLILNIAHEHMDQRNGRLIYVENFTTELKRRLPR